VQPSPIITTTVSGGSACAGNPVTLSASGASSYTWLPFNQTGSQITITPTTSMCYTVYGTAPSGCSNSATNCFSVIPFTNLTVTGNNNICAGDSTVLTASGAGSYTWLPGGATGASIMVSPLSSICYTVLGNNGGCANSGLYCVTVQSTTLAVSGSSVVCGNGSTTLSVNGSLSYTWMPGNLVGNSIVVSPTATTCYSVIGTNSTGCSSVGFKCVSVQNAPMLTIAGNTNVCHGSTTSFLVSGASSYTWSTGSHNALITVLTLSNSCFFVTGTTAGGCQTSGSVCVNIMPAPAVAAVAGTGIVCPGQSTLLQATGAQNYTWSTGATSDSLRVSPNVTTTYTVTGVNSNGCAGKAVVTVTVKPGPNLMVAPHDSIVCPGQQVFLSVSGAQSYTWSTGVSSPSTVVTPTASTIYTVVGSTNGCSSAVTIAVQVFSCTALQDLKTQSRLISMYPNPAQNELIITENTGTPVLYTLSETTGRIIATGEFSSSASLNLSEYANGVYIMRFEADNNISYQKFIIQK
jgi:hypothetical protein